MMAVIDEFYRSLSLIGLFHAEGGVGRKTKCEFPGDYISKKKMKFSKIPVFQGYMCKR